MGVFCDRLKLGSTAPLDCQTAKTKTVIEKKELSFLLVSLYRTVRVHKNIIMNKFKSKKKANHNS